jgi:hypothetical protein
LDGAWLKVPHDAAGALIPSSVSLRSRKIVDVPVAQMERVTVDSTDVHQVLRRSPSGGWTLEEPRGFAVDPGLAADLAEAFGQLRAERWVTEEGDDGSSGLSSPRAWYQLDREGGSVRVEVGAATAGGAFARRVDLAGVFVVSSASLRALGTWAIDRSYFAVDPELVRRIDLTRGALHFELASGANADAGSRAESFEVARRELGQLRAEGVVHIGAARPPEGFATPLLTVSVQLAPAVAGGPARTLKFFIGKGDSWRDTNVFFARREGVDATFAIAQGKIRPLLELH